jgi:hypothetical protein
MPEKKKVKEGVMSRPETAVVGSSPLQIPVTTPVITAVVVKNRVECMKETCTVAVIHIIGTYTTTQCTMVFEERRGAKEVKW